MLAVTVVPGTAGSARLDDVAEPDADLGSVVVEALAVGVCGTIWRSRADSTGGRRLVRNG
jgi:threonine dehydrogenase-like Zn-dependent dehydrogenase